VGSKVVIRPGRPPGDFVIRRVRREGLAEDDDGLAHLHHIGPLRVKIVSLDLGISRYRGRRWYRNRLARGSSAPNCAKYEGCGAEINPQISAII